MVLYKFTSSYNNTDSIGYNSSMAIEAQQHANLERPNKTPSGAKLSSYFGTEYYPRERKVNVLLKSIDAELMLLTKCYTKPPELCN